nr:hypothetical protein [uncultured Moellerella sp.]
MDKYIVLYEGLGLSGSVLIRGQVAINIDMANSTADKFLSIFNNEALNDLRNANVTIACLAIVSVFKL